MEFDQHELVAPKAYVNNRTQQTLPMLSRHKTRQIVQTPCCRPVTGYWFLFTPTGSGHIESPSTHETTNERWLLLSRASSLSDSGVIAAADRFHPLLAKAAAVHTADPDPLLQHSTVNSRHFTSVQLRNITNQDAIELTCGASPLSFPQSISYCCCASNKAPTDWLAVRSVYVFWLHFLDLTISQRSFAHPHKQFPRCVSIRHPPINC